MGNGGQGERLRIWKWISSFASCGYSRKQLGGRSVPTTGAGEKRKKKNKPSSPKMDIPRDSDGFFRIGRSSDSIT